MSPKPVLGQVKTVASQIPIRVENIQELREKYLAALDQYENERAKLEAEVAKLGKTLEGIIDEVAGLEVSAQAQRKEILERQAVSSRHAANISRIRDAALTQLFRTRRNIEAGIPFGQAARLNELSDAERKLKSDDPSWLADGINRYFIFHRKEFRLARSTEILSDVVGLSESRQLPGYLLRFGLVAQWFVTEDGTWVGRFNPNGHENISETAEAAKVLEAFAVLRRRRMPGLVSLVLPVNSRIDQD